MPVTLKPRVELAGYRLTTDRIRIVIGGVAALSAAVFVWWVAGRPWMSDAAHVVWYWLTPGWKAWARVGFALLVAAACGGALMLRRSPARREGWRTRAWPLFPTVAAAVFVGLLLVWIGYMIITHSLSAKTGEPPTRIDVLKTALTAVAGVGGAVALVVAYRRQRDLEEGRFIERFGAAAAQLGDSDPAVRIAGVYAMASAADESTTDARIQQCIDVLCGYLRLPYDPELGSSDVTERTTTTRPPSSAVLQTGQETTTLRRFRQNDRVVRQTIVRVIEAHLQSSTRRNWCERSFDFAGVVFEDATFTRANFRGDSTIFRGARFTGECWFEDARFEGDSWFTSARFEGETRFTRTRFVGETAFVDACFDGETWFDEALFQGATWFIGAHFAGTTRFDDAAFRGPISFGEAHFTGTTAFPGADLGNRLTWPPK